LKNDFTNQDEEISFDKNSEMLSNFHESDLKSANPQENNDNESMTFAY